MKLYPIPGGTWAGTEADWKRQMKAAGYNPKDFEATKTREVPTAKGDLIEFLNFFAVDVYRSGEQRPAFAGAPSLAPSDIVVDVEALRDVHNPSPEAAAASAVKVAAPPSDTKYRLADSIGLDDLFLAAPLGQQLTLAALACEAGYKQLGK